MNAKKSRGVYVHPECLAAMLVLESDPGGTTDAQDQVSICLKCQRHHAEAREERTRLMAILMASEDEAIRTRHA